METDLEISAGEVLTVEDGQDVGDWWYGRNEQGKYGYFPSNFVKELPVSTTSTEEEGDNCHEDKGQDQGQNEVFYAQRTI